MAASTSAKLSVTEKVGYSLADGAAQFVFLTMVNFQSGFYTDAMGISASHASWLVLVARLWDAFFDPMMGFIADRTKTRWGRFRPWILWSIIPWVACMVLAYTVPGFKSYTATFIYALVTNIALMTIYSMNNTPYSALMAVMTGDQKQRTNLSQYRFIVAMIGQLVVGGFTLVIMNSLGGPLALPPTQSAQTQLSAMTQAANPTTLPFTVTPEVAAKPAGKVELADTPAMQEYSKLKKDHDSQGWQRTMMVYGGICAVCFLITFFTTKERITPLQKKKSPITKDIATLATIGPWIVMFGVTVSHYVLQGMRGPAYQYYMQYVVDPESMKHFLQQWGIPASDGYDKYATWMPEFLRSACFSLLTKFKLVLLPDNSNVPAVVYGLLQMTNKVLNVLGIIAAGYLVSRFSKKLVVTLSCALNTVAILALYWIPVDHMTSGSIWGIYIIEWFGQLAYAPCVPLLWVLFADVCDYTEWKTGRNIAGFTYSTFFFALKAGNSLGNFLGLQIMAWFGYKANVVQTDRSKWGIILTFSLIPGIISLARVGSMLLYPITKKMNNDIADELTKRRTDAAAAAEKEKEKGTS
jgi:glycoside/pentoside/hexuronide:cation symporter, GPH family